MTGGRWQRIKDVLEAVEELSGAPRDAALDSLCGDDAELRREVNALLAQEDRIGVFERSGWAAAGAAAQPLRVGPYSVETLLGAGGMGAVYLASRSDDQYRKRVAIKVIQGVGGPDLERRFRRHVEQARQAFERLAAAAPADRSLQSRLADARAVPSGCTVAHP